MADTLSAALSYLKEGYSIIPLLPNSKRPLIKWEEYQSRKASEEEVKQWWTQTPEANLGIVCGKISNLTVIDVDGQDGQESSKRIAGIPPTRIVKTPKGYHLYFRYNENFHTGAAFLPGIDSRGDGGYVVAPPSVIDGKTYVVFKDLPVAEIALTPKEFQARHRKGTTPEKEKGEQPSWVSEALAKGAPLHSRNDTAIRLAGYFHSKNMPPDIIEGIMAPFAEKCQPPMELRELRTVIESASKYPTPETPESFTEPKIEYGPGYYIFDWPEIRMRLDRLRSRGETISAELQVHQSGRYLYGADRLSLTNRESRVKASKGLHALPQCNGYNWIAMLDFVAQATLDKQRAGEPFKEVGTMPMRTSPHWLLEPILPLNHPTILFGAGGIGKTTTAELLGICVQIGWGKEIGLIPHITGPVLYLDWEGSAEDINETLMAFEAGLGLNTTPRFIYLFCSQPLIDMLETIQEEVFRCKAVLVIVDSAVPALGGAREARENAEPLFQALRELKTTSLIISHEVKDQIQKKRTPYGDVFFWNRARMVWHLKGDPDQEGSEIELGWQNVKANFVSRQQQWGLRLTRDETNSIKAERFDVKDSPVLRQGLSHTIRIKEALRRGSLSSAALAKELDIPQDSIKVELSRGKKRGIFQQLEGQPPLWGLAGKNIYS